MGRLRIAVITALTAAVWFMSSANPAGAVDDVDCPDFEYQEDAQAFFEAAGPGDPHGLDANGDGRACEANPSRGTATPQPGVPASPQAPPTATPVAAAAPVDCADFEFQDDAQEFLGLTGPGDPHNLDADRDGLACEALPAAGTPPRVIPTSPQQLPSTLEVDCADFEFQEDAQDFLVRTGPGDRHGLDADKDGIACEALSSELARPAATVSTTASPGQLTSTRDLDCSDFVYQEEAQAFFEQVGPGDPHGLDAENDGRACEALPSSVRTASAGRLGAAISATTDLPGPGNDDWGWIVSAGAIALALGGVACRFATTHYTARRQP